jgi:hypothetical protein
MKIREGEIVGIDLIGRIDALQLGLPVWSEKPKMRPDARP